MTEVDVDLGLDEVVDLDKVLKCTALDGCDNPATHRMTHMSPCFILYCEQHAARMEEKRKFHDFFRCAHCGAKRIPAFVLRLFRI